MTITRSDRFSMLDPTVEDNDKFEKKEYCQKCLKLEILVQLTERSYPDLKPEDPLPSDHDKWRQCPRCGTCYMLQYVKKESRLMPAHGYIPESPGDVGIAVVENVYSRRDRRERETRLERRVKEEMLSQIKDDDARILIKKGWKLTSYMANDDKLESDYQNAKSRVY
ncbi:MAG TPA: hypothetical protein VGE97_01205 [Nitrososphaera sp.]